MFDLHRLRLLRELKHRGTLAAVAAALSYSPSSVSQQLSLLESEAGVPLLEPVGRRVRLTPQAEILVAHTEAVLERLERAQADIATSLTELTGTLRVASFQTAALALLPAQVEQEDLCDDPLRLARPDHAARRDGGAPADPREVLRALADHPWVMEPEGTAARHWAMTLCRDAGFEPDVRFESTDLLFHVRLVEQGHAAALLPHLVWSGRRPTVALSPLPRDPQARRILTAVRRGRSGHPAVQACRGALRRASGGDTPITP
ncbi:LysR family transcriptional regulator [Planotetraspora silvatica]|uniref:LysR family transcriptional regulator n=1 Tax=Planotetraspora silvatica TaxID=234614 RepID=A0A8J3UTW9_9ACTN|nr:LysR family transcriptional regulator [Planotetraspora silvatica]GII48314.1 LysR family transcriptional regulator [Planotetraspora silvatica]